jgi:NAD(P)-dependent dehydrogenase (short-subunit alcohol dehydrogenase family)
MPHEPKIAVVTGGGGGLGRAMVLGLLRTGFRVAAVDRDAALLEAVAASAENGSPLVTLAADLADPTAAEAAVADVRDRWGRIDILVNNAGIGTEQLRRDHWQNPVRFWEIAPVQWARFMAVNGSAAFLMARAVGPGMIAQGWGRVINVTTSLDTMTRGGFAAYGASKAATEALTAVMAADLAGTGVTANVLVPGGPADTPMVVEESGFDRASLLRPEVMVPPLLWLVSDAADAVTARRFIAARWDPALTATQAATAASAPVAWLDLGAQMIIPRKRAG